MLLRHVRHGLASVSGVYDHLGGILLLLLHAIAGFVPQLFPRVIHIGEKRRLRWDRLGRTLWRSAGQVAKVGAQGVPIGSVIIVLVAIATAWPAADQLRKFGASLYIADIVAIGFTSQMSPMIMAILVAGRSGSGIAAEIGSMQVAEETMALRAMGVDPVHVLVVPRLIGMIAGLLFLTILGMILGILAGGVVAFFGLDLTFEVYTDRVLEVLSAENATWVLQGVMKSLAFGATVAIVSCFQGFQVHGGADAVGRAATAAVVESIFMIIAINTILTLLYTVGG